MERMPVHLALEDRDEVLAVYLDDDGSIRQIPRKHREKLVLLDHVSRVFEPGARPCPFPHSSAGRDTGVVGRHA